MLKYALFVLLYSLLASQNLIAQLDVEHYIPPFYSRTDDPSICGAHYLVLTTEVEKPFFVTIYEGDIFIDSIRISKRNPYKYNLGSGYTAIGIVQSSKLNTPLIREGLHLKALYPFFATIRHRAKNQGGALTSKGRFALGEKFRTGFLLSFDEDHDCSSCSNFISIMATEDETNVFISNIGKGIYFYNAKKLYSEKGNKFIHFKLNKGESYVLAVHSDDLYTDPNNLIGTSIVADKPIAVNSGSWLARAKGSKLDHDIGFDQIIPERMLGSQYVLIKGEGVDAQERPIIVAVKDSTVINANGQFKNILSEGEYMVLDGSEFSADENLYIEASRPIYVYQNTAGSKGLMTSGMNLIPPLYSCSNNNNVRISDIKLIADSVVLQVIAQAGEEVVIKDVDRDEVIFYKRENKSNILGGGTIKWVTYKYNLPNYVNDVSISSSGTINSGLCYHSSFLGAASYLSGHARGPVLVNRGKDYLQLGDSANFFVINDKGYDSFQWYRDGDFILETFRPNVKFGKTGEYFVIGITGKEECDKGSFSDPYQIYKYVKEENPEYILNDSLRSIDELYKMASGINDSVNGKLMTPIYFEYNSFELSENYKTYLKEIVGSVLKGNDDDRVIEVSGHSDCLGTNEYNFALSKKRATSVRDYFRKLGIKSHQIKVKAEGNTQPYVDCICYDCNEKQHQKNRRVEVKMLNFYQ